jgi:hypothetical protein
MSVLRLFPWTEASEEKLTDEAVARDLSLAFLGYALLLVFTLIVLWKPRNRVKSQAMLTFAAVLSVGLAIGASHGIAASKCHCALQMARVCYPVLTTAVVVSPPWRDAAHAVSGVKYNTTVSGTCEKSPSQLLCLLASLAS